MYLAQTNRKRSITAKAYLKLSVSARKEIKDALKCIECGNKVFFASGPINRAHFRHFVRQTSGICSKQKKYIYKKSDPSDVSRVIKDIGFINIIGLRKKNSKTSNSDKKYSDEDQPGKHDKVDEPEQHPKITLPNKTSLKLEDLLKFLVSEEFQKIDKILLADTTVRILGHELFFNDAVVHIEEVDWHSECGKFVKPLPRIYWGKIYNSRCFDSHNHLLKMQEVSLGGDRYRLAINFGNRQHKRPNVYFNESTTKSFLSKFHSEGIDDIKGYLATFSNGLQSAHDCPKIKISKFNENTFCFLKN
ncbi:hypothetical protein CC99x_002610 [Candidatus Berkiella cookevillensis]|uniref:Uncharacterized protein n=1 Tax=Candidatus Berkiella cookevillensis TaxID=437022 RepID=A0A0Q9Y939_9GAMM|nr:hypothetical protein [Candidatus Berkiella cookevillensis]MCS5707789.1 hypothetical protein [Candidatus Berkiella cookevillensis]